MITEKKIGILGGGQLGKMLCEAASPWHLNISILDKDASMPAAPYCHSFTCGNFKNYKDVLSFGKKVDILTIEIEHVNLDALFDLEKLGVEIRPKPEALVQIVDKGLQKNFYKSNGIPTASFELLDSREEIIEGIANGNISLPFVQKTRKEGYDGRGVQVIRTKKDFDSIMDTPSVIENLVEIDREIAVIAARNPHGQVECFEPVDMIFNEGANLLDVLICPAGIDEPIKNSLNEIAIQIISKLDIVGLLAIEFFLDDKGDIYVNEVAPRPHNSGHHTIQNNIVSQFEQHLRAILDLPLIKPKVLMPAAMINVLGEQGYEGVPQFEGRDELLARPKAFFHWYGKTITKAYRKMGHITVVDKDINRALDQVRDIKQNFKIISKNK